MNTLLNVPATDPFLENLLTEGRSYDLFYGENLLSDHLPMALTSLRRLGASNAELIEFRKTYAAKLEPPRFGAAEAPEDPWPAARGCIQLYPGLRHYFDQALTRRGRDAVLLEWIPRLLPSAGVDAFHGLIRTAVAVESGVDAELACGLAYWLGVSANIPVNDGPRLDLPAGEMFERLRVSPSFAPESARLSGMFGDQLMQLAAQDTFRDLVRWRGQSVGLRELAQASARIYLASGHFFGLHMVTGSQAVHLLSPYCDDQAAAVDAPWISLAATYIIIGGPRYGVVSRAPETLPARSGVLAAALRQEDEHIVKLAMSAWREHDSWRLPEHRQILHAICEGTAALHF